MVLSSQLILVLSVLPLLSCTRDDDDDNNEEDVDYVRFAAGKRSLGKFISQG